MQKKNQRTVRINPPILLFSQAEQKSALTRSSRGRISSVSSSWENLQFSPSLHSPWTWKSRHGQSCDHRVKNKSIP